MRDVLTEILTRTAERIAGAGAPKPLLETPRQPEHGDFATSWALAAAKPLAKSPRALAEELAEALAAHPAVQSAQVAGPGFVNLIVNDATIQETRGLIRKRGATKFGHQDPNPGSQSINVEFVSVNPNGPITVGSGRGAAYGSALCAVLAAAGNHVHREYYINDGVNSEQMRAFAESVRALALGREVPEGGYKGDYVLRVAEALLGGLDLAPEAIRADANRLRSHAEGAGSEARRKHVLDGVATRRAAGETATQVIERLDAADLQILVQTEMVASQAADLSRFGVTFDTWFSEQSLHDNGVVAAHIEQLIANGLADDRPVRHTLTLAKGGAVEEASEEPQEGETGTLWLRSTKFGDDMDRVLRRGDGRLTYIASDVAYHADKLSRPAGTTKLITVLGPDHHGYIGRLRAVVAANNFVPRLGDTPLEGWQRTVYASAEEYAACTDALTSAEQTLDVQIFQLVRFVKDGEPAPMRKRDGNIYAIIDLIREIGEKVKPMSPAEEQLETGRDVARFFYLMRHHDTSFDFDLDLAERQSEDNPVFYVQYAHARIHGILNKARAVGLEAGEEHVESLEPQERALLIKAADLPYEVERCAEDYAVNRLANYAVELARQFHYFYDACRVIEQAQPELSRSRLATCDAARIALASCLTLLGVSAPVAMHRTAEDAT